MIAKIAFKINKLCTIKKFLRYFSLKDATLFIGYVMMMLHFADFIAESVSLSYKKEKAYSDAKNSQYYSYGFASEDTRYFSFLIIYQAFGFFYNIALLWGTYKNKHEFMVPWLIFNAASIILALVAIVIFLVIALIFGSYWWGEILMTLLYAVIAILSVGILFQIYRCVYSYYNELKGQETKLNLEDDLPPYENSTDVNEELKIDLSLKEENEVNHQYNLPPYEDSTKQNKESKIDLSLKEETTLQSQDTLQTNENSTEENK